MKDYRAMLRLYVRPELGSMKVAAVKRSDIEKLHRDVASGKLTPQKRPSPYPANRTVAMLSKMFTMSIGWEMRADNPARGIERALEHKRERFLSGTEIAKLSEVLAEHQEQLSANAVRLLLLTGARRTEVLSATWGQFDLAAGLWTKPAATTKQKKDHRLPLSAPARQLLAGMKAAADQENARPGPTGTIGTSVEHLDLATVIKITQAVVGEIVRDKLLDTLLRTALEHAGADRGLLILSRGTERRIVAEVATGGETVTVQLRDEPVAADALPELILHYVLRTHETVVLNDAAARNEFSSDPYIQQLQARSILCLPLITQAKLIGVLYLENNLTPGVFTSGAIAVLRLLASQAAIAFENARLYRDLEERESKIRRLVDANIIGIIIWEHGGRILEANDAFLRMVGYDREDLIAGRLRWTDLTPPEWLDRHEQRWTPELKTTGSIRPFEKEYFRKDGSRVPVLVGVASFEEGGNQGVSFVLDLTERKQAEVLYRDVQTELAHANRVATMGQLTASIAHEVKQPIAATVINTQAALRWLAGHPPDVEEARRALGRILKDGTRAGDIIDRIHALTKKGPSRKDRFEINGTIREVIELSRSAAAKNGVSAQTDLAEGLPLIEGDRVQLQQVILNLIMNAVEAMGGVSDGSRELLLSTRKAEPGGVLVTVKDSGPGLAPADVERVFDPFYTTKPGGLGMGLSICRSLIEAHGGRLWVTANLPRGSIFQFTVPA